MGNAKRNPSLDLTRHLWHGELSAPLSSLTEKLMVCRCGHIGPPLRNVMWGSGRLAPMRLTPGKGIVAKHRISPPGSGVCHEECGPTYESPSSRCMEHVRITCLPRYTTLWTEYPSRQVSCTVDITETVPPLREGTGSG